MTDRETIEAVRAFRDAVAGELPGYETGAAYSLHEAIHGETWCRRIVEALDTILADTPAPTPEDHPGMACAQSTNRGFVALPAVEARTGGYVRVRECSLATEPAIWLDVAEPADLNDAGMLIATGRRSEVVLQQEQTIQLAAAGARQLCDQLDAALRFHYQGDCSATQEPF